MATVKNDTEKKVKIRLPRERNQSATEIVWVNERRFEIKRGVEVEVPECVYEVLQRKEESLNALYDTIDASTN